MTGGSVVVTGIGVVAPGEPGTAAFWERMTAGRPATRAITSFDASAYRSRIAAECDFDPVAAGVDTADGHRDRVTQLALAAAREALGDSGVGEPADPGRTAVTIGSAVGCTQQLERRYVEVSAAGRDWCVRTADPLARLYDQMVPSSIAAEVAWEAGAEGPVAVVSNGCTSGIDAIAHACDLIREGTVDVAVAGGAEAPISPITVACFDAIRATSRLNDTPGSASRPFDSTRTGFVLGEGAAVLVLEDERHAQDRGARVYARIAGYAGRGNAYHMTGLRPDGRELAAAVTGALDDARLDPMAIDYVNAHGTATVQNDIHETAALRRSLGARAEQVPVSSIKSMIGHSLGAVGAIEVASCALSLERGVVLPTANLHDPDPALGLDFVPLTAREQSLTTALTVGSGFGGFQSAMVLTRSEGVLV